MSLNQLLEVLSRVADTHVREAQSFERLALRDHDYLESSFGQKYHEGATDAYRTVITSLRRVMDLDEPINDAFAFALRTTEEVPEAEQVAWMPTESEGNSIAIQPCGPCIA